MHPSSNKRKVITSAHGGRHTSIKCVGRTLNAALHTHQHTNTLIALLICVYLCIHASVCLCSVSPLRGARRDLRKLLLSAFLFVHVNTNMKEPPCGQQCWPFLWWDSTGCKIFAQPMPDTLFTAGNSFKCRRSICLQRCSSVQSRVESKLSGIALIEDSVQRRE